MPIVEQIHALRRYLRTMDADCNRASLGFNHLSRKRKVEGEWVSLRRLAAHQGRAAVRARRSNVAAPSPRIRITKSEDALPEDTERQRAAFRRLAEALLVDARDRGEIKHLIKWVQERHARAFSRMLSKLHGMHVPFSDAKLSRLYPTHEAYVRAVKEAVKNSRKDGFLLKDDADEIIKRAESSPVGTGRPVPIH